MTKIKNKNTERMKVVVMGGGTGTFTELTGLKHYLLDLTAIVSMADDGGSTGILRDEFGVLPPGDLRQCLVALSDADLVMRKLFTHRYDRGGLKGHSFGNIFISTLEQITGSLDEALLVASTILNIRGKVIPVTLDNIALHAELQNGKLLKGESAFMEYQLVSKYGIKKIFLEPSGKANPKALAAIKDADLIVVGPGKLYTSIVPNFLVGGVSRAFIKSKAKKVFVANLMSQQGHTDNFSVTDYATVLEEYIGAHVFDAILYNTKSPPESLVRRYADEGEPVVLTAACAKSRYTLVGSDLLAADIAETPKKDLLRRTLIRHDPDKLARALMEILENDSHNTSKRK
jgi:uncharacterized cofD-like protein